MWIEVTTTNGVRVATGTGGARFYAIDLPPEAMPAVQGRDLAAAWSAAREAAIGARWDVARGFRFRRIDGSHYDIALLDRDASCWAGAVELTVGMSTRYGVSLCLRLIALVDLLARARWTDPFFALTRTGARLHPALVRAAACAPLTADVRFDETVMQAALAVTGDPALESFGVS
jgi:hypothetical protein